MDKGATILEMPIFPLGTTVLFPGATLALHIFEERYKAMIGRCLAGDRAFGVTLLRAGREVGGEAIPYEIGTVAQIAQAVRMQDGCYNLVARGASRFQLLSSSYEDAGYLTGRVELLVEEEHDEHRLPALVAGVQRGFAGLIGDLAALTEATVETIAFPDDPTGVSYFVAAHLPIYVRERQHLLEATTTDARLAEERRLIARERGMLREFGVVPATMQIDDGAPDRILVN